MVRYNYETTEHPTLETLNKITSIHIGNQKIKKRAVKAEEKLVEL